VHIYAQYGGVEEIESKRVSFAKLELGTRIKARRGKKDVTVVQITFTASRVNV
jgi:hypothetical protein